MVEEVKGTKAEKKKLDVMTTAKRLPLIVLFTIFMNYFVTLLSVAIASSFYDLRNLFEDGNVFPLYIGLFPFTFIVLSMIILKKRDEK